MSAEISIRVLGPSSVGAQPGQLPLTRPVERALWRLVVAMPSMVPIDALVSAIWEDSPPTSWKSALRTHLSQLRGLLRETPEGPQLVRGRSGYALVGSLDSVDLHRFRSLVDSSQFSEPPQAQLALLDEANDLWRGEPFGGSGSPDLHLWSERMSGLREEMVRRRDLLSVELGGAEAVVRRLRGPVEQDPQDVSLVETLIAAYLALDRVSDAKRVLARHRTALESLGWEPSLGSAAIERRLLRREVEDQRGAGVLLEMPQLLRRSKVLVGRAAEMTAFRDAVDARGCSYIAVMGPAGIGKSHLAAKMAEEAHSAGIPVLAAWADEHSPPFQVFSDVLRPWLDLIPGPSSETFETMLSCLVDVSPGHRVVVIFEDVHFADLASSKIIGRLLRREPIDGVTFVFTARESGGNANIVRFLRELRETETARTLHLGPVTVEDTFELVQHTNEISPSAAWTLSSRLHRISQGFPLVLDLLLNDTALGDSAVPQDVTELTASIATRLAEAELDVLVTGALLSTEFDLRSVVDATGLSIARVTDAVDRAAEAGLTERRVENRVRFRHPLVQAAIVDRRSAVWRCEKHRRLAIALRERSADVFTVCQQWASALPDETSDEIIGIVFAGIAELQASNRWEESFALLEIIAPTFDAHPWWLKTPEIFRYLMLRAAASDGCADADLARQYFRMAKAFAEKHHNPEWAFEVAIASSVSSQPLDGDEERADWLRSAFHPDSGIDDSLRVQALSEFVYLRGLAALDPEVEDCLAQMKVLTDRLGDNRSRAHCAHGELVTLVSSPDAERRLRLSTEARAWAEGTPPEVAVTPILTKVFSLLQLGARSEVDDELLAIEELVNLRQRPGDRWIVFLLRAMLAEWDGRGDHADRHANMARTLALRHDIRGGRETWGAFQIARVWRNADWAIGKLFFTPDEDAFLIEHALAALFLARTGDTAQARAVLTRVAGALANESRAVSWLGACMAAGEAASVVASPTVPLLRELLSPHSGLIEINGLVASSTFGPVDRVLAMLAAASGDEREAERLRQRSARQLEKAGLSGWRNDR